MHAWCKMPTLLFLSLILLVQYTKVNAVACANTNSLRLYGGNSDNSGIPQICTGGNWHSVCSNSWDCNDAKVACRQLGYSGFFAHYPSCCGQYGNWTPKDNRSWSCTGSESDLMTCSSAFSTSCTTSGTPGLFCNTLIEGSNCTHDDVRLVGEASEGRVEICYEGTWLSVCHVHLHAASFICKTLGYSQYASIIYPSTYGSVSNPVNTVYCSPSTTNFNGCSKYLYSSCQTSVTMFACSAAIRCYSYNSTDQNCFEGSVRLVDGDIDQEGILEVCYNGIWGEIFNDNWQAENSFVACRQLGYSIATTLTTSSLSSGHNQPVLYANVACTGTEETLAECTKNTYPFSTSYLHYSYSSVQIRCYEDCTDGDIRLSGGLTEYEGTVEICKEKLWGLVSDSNWGENEARVVCRQLGFQTQSIQALSDSYYGRPNRTMHYSMVVCTGAENRLTQCGKTTLSLTTGKTVYKGVDAAGVSCNGPPTTLPPCIPPTSIPLLPVCTNGQLQLVGGQSSAEGILQYCYNGQWSHFCTLQPQEATIACKTLGYTLYSRAGIFTNGQSFGSSNKSYSLFQNISCSNSELNNLDDCMVNGVDDCLPSCYPIGIRCYEPSSCEEGKLRLANGVIEQEGRVEVCINGVWGSVCDMNWDKTDAHIVCREMGYPELEPIAFHNSYFGDGYGPIVFSNVSCGGWEQQVTDCAKSAYPLFTCSRDQTAGVLCGEYCNDGDVRLIGGSNEYEGTVEICFGNIWGLISETGWGDSDAEVVCRQLGYNTKDAASFVNSHFGKPNKTIQVSSVACSGNELHLLECTMTSYDLETGKSLLQHVDVVGVSCAFDLCEDNNLPASACIKSDVRLIEGTTANNGKLEFCYEGIWTPACSVGLPEATVTCRQLGHAKYAWAATVTYDNIIPANSSYFINSTCSGAEFDLNGCLSERICSSTCTHSIIHCFVTSHPCDEGALRLAGGSDNNNGQVEVCYNGVWGTVCRDNWSNANAIVVCKQLGLTGGVVYAVTNSSTNGQQPVVFSDVSCNGMESTISECSKNLHGTFECSSNNVAGVICIEACSNGAVRLVGGAAETEGTVEVCLRSVWGVIQSTGWTIRDSSVVCKQLGYPSSGAEAVFNSMFGKPSKFVHLSSVQCSGTEDTLFDCNIAVIPQEVLVNVAGLDVAGVICRSAPTITPSMSNTIIGTVAMPRSTSPELPLYIIVGFLCIVIIVLGIIVIVFATFICKMKTGRMIYSATMEDNQALIKDNPAYNEAIN